MARSVLVKYSFLLVLPSILFFACAALCVIGNLVYVMTSTNSTSTISWWIWGIRTCSTTSGLCSTQSVSDINIGGSSECDSWMHQLRAAEAMGVLACLVSGVSFVCSMALLFCQVELTFPRVVVVGYILSLANAAASTTEFLLSLTLKYRSCITNLTLTETTFEVAPFLFLGSLTLSLLVAYVYFLIGSCESYNERRRRVVAPDSHPQPHTTTTAWVAETEANRGVHAAQSPVSIAVAQPQAGTVEATRERSVNALPSTVATVPQRSISPSTVQQPNSVSVQPGDEDDLMPDGDDWEVDEPSGLLWSEEKNLFFDRGSGHFYDPDSEQWFNPDEDRWYTIPASGVLPSRP